MKKTNNFTDSAVTTRSSINFEYNEEDIKKLSSVSDYWKNKLTSLLTVNYMSNMQTIEELNNFKKDILSENMLVEIRLIDEFMKAGDFPGNVIFSEDVYASWLPEDKKNNMFRKLISIFNKHTKQL